MEIIWKDVVKEALDKLGGKAHLSKINKEIESHPKTITNPTWRATVRRTLQQYNIFTQEKKGSGVWLLKEEQISKEFDSKLNPNPKHGDIQGMLLELGKIYGFETIIPNYDKQKLFMGKKLGEIATLSELPKFTYPRMLKIVGLIDVLWFLGDINSYIPTYAFEVEHSTDITKGLVRLSEFYESGTRSKLFVILPIEKKNKFENEINKAIFRQIRGICIPRDYKTLIELYNTSLLHFEKKQEFFNGGL